MLLGLPHHFNHAVGIVYLALVPAEDIGPWCFIITEPVSEFGDIFLTSTLIEHFGEKPEIIPEKLTSVFPIK